MEYIIPIVLVIAVLVAFSFVWFKKSEPSEDQEESIEVFADRIIVERSNVRTPTRPEEPDPYFDETHFYFKGSSSPVIAMGNYLPLIPVVCDGNQRLRYTTKNGLEGIMKLSDLERAIYFPAVDPETLKTKDSSNG